MTIPEGLYTVAMWLASAALPLASRGGGKLARGIRGRRGAVERMEGWGRASRDPARPLVWFHAASVGEGLQAIAVMRALRERRPDAQIVYTFFSPSAEILASRAPADFADYLPLDLPGDVRRALDALRPNLIAFSKHDVWPNLVQAASRRGTRMVLLSATLPASSSRLRGPARALLLPAYKRLDAIAAISTDDAARFALLGVPASRRSVMGDARFDQVRERATTADVAGGLLRTLAYEGVTLVAGSTWEEDEERLIPAWAGVRTGESRLILVPHEPTDTHLERTERLLGAAGLTSRRLSREGGRTDVLLVDRVGVLGELYALADLAYVGGGWGAAGLHSVLEPAAFGVPVLFGPRHENAREAAELIGAGGAHAVRSEGELAERLRGLLGEAESRRRTGEAARRYVQQGTGAANRGADVIDRLLQG